jgi:hypothetical protein
VGYFGGIACDSWPPARASAMIWRRFSMPSLVKALSDTTDRAETVLLAHPHPCTNAGRTAFSRSLYTGREKFAKAHFL